MIVRVIAKKTKWNNLADVDSLKTQDVIDAIKHVGGLVMSDGYQDANEYYKYINGPPWLEPWWNAEPTAYDRSDAVRDGAGIGAALGFAAGVASGVPNGGGVGSISGGFIGGAIGGGLYGVIMSGDGSAVLSGNYNAMGDFVGGGN